MEHAVKGNAAMMGLIDNEIRLPLTNMSAESSQKLKRELAALGLLASTSSAIV